MAKIGLTSMATVFVIRFMMKVVYHIKRGYKHKKYMMDLDNMKVVLPMIIKQIDIQIEQE